MHKEPLWELDLEASRLCERVKKSRGASEAKGRSAGDFGRGPSLPPSVSCGLCDAGPDGARGLEAARAADPGAAPVRRASLQADT